MQDAGQVGRRAQGVLTHTWVTVLLQWSALHLFVAYLVSTSVRSLAPVASRVIRWASARHKPAISIVFMARLALDRVWASPAAVGGCAGTHLQVSPASASCNILQYYFYCYSYCYLSNYSLYYYFYL